MEDIYFSKIYWYGCIYILYITTKNAELYWNIMKTTIFGFGNISKLTLTSSPQPKPTTQAKTHIFLKTSSLQDRLVMTKVTNTRIKAKNIPHSQEKAFNLTFLGILGIHSCFLKSSCNTWLPYCPIDPLRCPLKLN